MTQKLIRGPGLIRLGGSAGLIALLFLAGCGGDDGTGPVGQGGNQGGAADAFTARVLATASTAPEEAEPVDVNAVAPTTPEDTEPSNL